MPRLQRRSRLKTGELTADQAAVLQHGRMIGVLGDPFEKETSELACWRKHRAVLMANCEPGTRPSAFFKFELKIQPTRVIDMLMALFDAGLVEPAEALAIENVHLMLNPVAARDFGSSFEDKGAQCRFGEETLRRKVGEFEFAERWHHWRNRPELVEVYRRRAATVREALEESR